MPNAEEQIYEKYLSVMYNIDPAGKTWLQPVSVWKQTGYHVFNADILTLVVNRMISLGVNRGDLLWDFDRKLVMLSIQGLIKVNALEIKDAEETIEKAEAEAAEEARGRIRRTNQ